jgi:hypothetical protein
VPAARLGLRLHRARMSAAGDPPPSELSAGDGREAWLHLAERTQLPLGAPHGAGLVPVCLSCRQYAPYRISERGARMKEELAKRSMLEWCSKCIQSSAGGRYLFEEGQVFGPATTGFALRRGGTGASPSPPVGSEAQRAPQTHEQAFVPRSESLAKQILEDSWQVDDSRTLTIAAGRGSQQEVKRLLAQAGSRLFEIDIEFRDPSGCTPLMCAAAKGRADVCATLLEAGACVEAADHLGYTPLQRASIAGHAPVITVLTYKHKPWAPAQLDRAVDIGNQGKHPGM